MKINLEIAKQFIGLPYVWGGKSLQEGGFDCSGYLYNVLIRSGIKVKRDTAQGYFNTFKKYKVSGSPVSGDLLFFGKSLNNITHVAIALNNSEMIESIGTSKNTIKNKGKGVTISKITRRKDLRAVVRFENVSRETLCCPSGTPNLRRGSMGVQVSNLQKCLNVLFSAGLKVDGQFGNATYNAVKKFQSASGLTSDGIYGSHSYRIMKNLVLNYNRG